MGLILFQSSCASSKKIPVLTKQTAWPRDQLFPDGVYIHQVNISAPTGKAKKLKVVVSVTPTAIMLVGLSFLNTTLFHLKEDRSSGEISMETFGPFPDKVKGEFESFYKVFRRLLIYSRKVDQNQKSADDWVEYDSNQFPILFRSKDSRIQIQIEQFDDSGIPRRLNAIHPMFKALVKISSYELRNNEKDGS